MLPLNDESLMLLLLLLVADTIHAAQRYCTSVPF
jgi:hypothetical protein